MSDRSEELVDSIQIRIRNAKLGLTQIAQVVLPGPVLARQGLEMCSRLRVSAAKNTDAVSPLYSVSFTNGILDDSFHSQIATQVYKHTSNENVMKMVVSTGDMDYSGNFDHSKADDGKYIGVENEETGVMTIVPLKRIRLRPAVSITYDDADKEPLEQPSKSRQEQSDSLIESFGGAKQKQNMLRRQKHGIDKTMIYDALDAARVEDIKVLDTTLDTSIKIEDESIIPTCDMETTDPDKAYPLDGYFPVKIQTDLSAFVDDFVAVDSATLLEWRQKLRYPDTILDLLEKLPLDEERRKSAAIRVKYLSYLIRLYKLKVADLRAKDPLQHNDEDGLYKMPASCSHYLLDTYTVRANKARNMPNRLKDKLLVVILILSLGMEGWKMPCRMLVSDLKTGARKLATIARAIGCKVSADKAAYSDEVRNVSIELKLPLKFPEQKTTKQRRRN